MTDPKSALEWALSYAASGWHVFPVQPAIVGDPDSGKRPVGQLVPNGKLNATTDAAKIREWWSSGNWNIGVACEPSGIVVLDIDTGLKKDGSQKQGQASLDAIAEHMHHTLTASTGGGGAHAIYERPTDFTTGSKIGFADGLDLISNGYIVVAPSTHYTGGCYSWLQQIPVAPLPEYLRGIARATRTATTTLSASAAGVAKISEGGRNNAMFRLGAALLSATALSGQSLLAAMIMENERRFVPPLPEGEVKQICDSVLRTVQPQRDAAFGAVIDQQLASIAKLERPADDKPKQELPNTIRAIDLLPSLVLQAKQPIVRLPFKQLDERIDGLSLHSNTVIVAGTGKGKSSLAGTLSLHHATSGQGPVIYYVGEMTRELVLARMIGIKLKASWVDVLRGNVPQDKMVAALEGLPIYFVKRSDEPLKAIMQALVQAADDGDWTDDKVPMIVVDYIQLLASVGADMRISTMQAVREFRQFVETAPVVALTLSQSSRSGSKQMRDGAESAEEMIGMGAETAELEQSCTNQLVLSFKSKDGTTEHDVTMMVAKSRFGGNTKLGFIFNGKTGEWIPTEKPPIDPKHQKRMDEILQHVCNHTAGRCNDGMFCGRKMNITLLREKNSPHWVDGNGQAHKQAIEDLEELRLIRCEGGIYFPANNLPKRSV